MTPKALAEWILTLPPDIQNGAVCGIVSEMIFTAKRVTAWQSSDKTAGIYVEPMGTHAKHRDGMKYPAWIEHGGEGKKA